MATSMIRTRWAAVGAALAVTLGAGGIGLVDAAKTSGERAVYTAIEPCRLLDSRPNQGVGGRTTPLGPGEIYAIDLQNSADECDSVPTDVTAVGLNVTALLATQLSDIRFWAEGDPPNAANLNPDAGQPPTPNAVTTEVASDGTFLVRNQAGSVHLVIDLVGIYQDHRHDDRYYTEDEVDDLIASIPEGPEGPPGPPGPGAADYENVVVVAKSGGDFTSVTAAMNAIGTDPDYPAASANRRYLVWVAPGVYDDEDVDMQPFVDIQGSGQGVTVLTSTGGGGGISPDSATLVGAADAELRDITVEINGNPGTWSHAIYTATSTRFHRVTAAATGGSRPRGMMVTGGAPVLVDVIVRAIDGSDSNLALDLVAATAFADGLFADASGGNIVEAIFINSATSEVTLENVTARASNGATKTTGVRTNLSDVTLEGLRSIATASSGSAVGVDCDDEGRSVTMLDATIFAEVSSGPGIAFGVAGFDCDIELRNAVVDAVGNDGEAIGILHTQADASLGADVVIADVETRAESANWTATGIRLASTGATPAGTFGRITDLNARAAGGTLASNTRVVEHLAAGEVHYRGLSLTAGGSANFLYGIQTAGDGTPRFDDVVIDAAGEAAITVFGVEFLTDATTLSNARVRAVNTAADGSSDAVGLKSNGADGSSFSDVTAYAEAETNTWGVDLTGATGARLVGVDATAAGSSAVSFGIRCWGGSGHELHDSWFAADPASASSYGMYAISDCAVEVRGSSLAGKVSLRTLDTADVLIVDTNLSGGAATSGSASDTQTCVAITYDSGGTDKFEAGPVDPCP